MWGLIARALVLCFRAALAPAGRVAVTAVGGRAAAVATTTAAMSRFGRIAFDGLINNRLLTGLTQQEIRNAFARIGLREAHNSHFISRLVWRGPNFGITTLADFARAVNNGAARVGASPGTIDIVLPGGRVAVTLNGAGELVTFLPLGQ